MLTKKEAKKLVEEVKGEARGISLKDDLDFVFETKKEEGLKRVEERMAELGYPINYKEIKAMEFYPMGVANLLLLVIKETFNFNKEDLEKWGASIVKFSLFTKVFLKYFGSLGRVAIEAPKNWARHYTVGKLTMPEYSRKEKYTILRLHDFKVHPIHCAILKGYFRKISEMVVKSPAKCEETKCSFKGDDYHEFFVTWQ